MLWRRVADARENERGGGGEHGIRRTRRRRRGGTDGRVLCAARLSSTAAPAVVFSQPQAIPRRVPVAGTGEGSEEREIGRRAAEGRIRIGRRPSESSTEISLASLRFRIRDSRGAANLPPPAEESELLFPLIQRASRTPPAGSTCKEPGEYPAGNPSPPVGRGIAGVARVSSR